MEPTPTWTPYQIDCPFCSKRHLSFYADTLEEIVMECRERTPPEHRGLLEYTNMETVPTTVEQVAYAVEIARVAYAVEIALSHACGVE